MKCKASCANNQELLYNCQHLGSHTGSKQSKHGLTAICTHALAPCCNCYTLTTSMLHCLSTYERSTRSESKPAPGMRCNCTQQLPLHWKPLALSLHCYHSSCTAAIAGIFSLNFCVTATRTVMTFAAGPVILILTIGPSMLSSMSSPPPVPTR